MESLGIEIQFSIEAKDLSPKRPDLLWGPFSFQFNVKRGVFLSSRE